MQPTIVVYELSGSKKFVFSDFVTHFIGLGDALSQTSDEFSAYESVEIWLEIPLGFCVI